MIIQKNKILKKIDFKKMKKNYKLMSKITWNQY